MAHEENFFTFSAKGGNEGNKACNCCAHFVLKNIILYLDIRSASLPNRWFQPVLKTWRPSRIQSLGATPLSLCVLCMSPLFSWLKTLHSGEPLPGSSPALGSCASRFLERNGGRHPITKNTGHAHPKSNGMVSYRMLFWWVWTYTDPVWNSSHDFYCMFLARQQPQTALDRQL